MDHTVIDSVLKFNSEPDHEDADEYAFQDEQVSYVY